MRLQQFTLGCENVIMTVQFSGLHLSMIMNGARLICSKCGKDV